MATKNKRFKRPTGERPYRKIFHLFCEGCETEPAYFAMIRRIYPHVTIFIYCHESKNRPQQILDRAKKFIKANNPGKYDFIWLVVDVDYNAKNELQPLIDWTNSAKKYGVAMSNPNFEYWLLLHFEKGDGLNNTKGCEKKLRKYMPNYQKNYLDEKKLILNINLAIDNAKNKHKQCHDWHTDYHTTVYMLVEKIINI